MYLPEHGQAAVAPAPHRSGVGGQRPRQNRMVTARFVRAITELGLSGVKPSDVPALGGQRSLRCAS